MTEKEKILKQLAEIYRQNPNPDIVDIYYRLSIILNDLKTIMENKKPE